MRKLTLFCCLVFAPLVARADYMYTFSNAAVPYLFSFIEPNLVTSPGSLGLAPFTVDGFNFTQAVVFGAGGSNQCFFFGTTGVVGDCDSGSVPPADAVMFSSFANPNVVGTYFAVQPEISIGILGFPTQLTISSTVVPEPAAIALFGTVVVALFPILRRTAARPT